MGGWCWGEGVCLWWSCSGLWKRRGKDGKTNTVKHDVSVVTSTAAAHPSPHLIHQHTARTPRPSALVYFCFSFSLYFYQPIPPSPLLLPPPPFSFSDLVRALSPEERRKSFWQTAAFVEEQEIARREKPDKKEGYEAQRQAGIERQRERDHLIPF